MKDDDAGDPVARRTRLLARSAELRVTLAHEAQVLKAPLAVADQLVVAATWLVRNPAWPLAGLVLLVAARPRRVIGWGARLWWGWNAWRRVQRWIAAAPQP